MPRNTGLVEKYAAHLLAAGQFEKTTQVLNGLEDRSPDGDHMFLVAVDPRRRAVRRVRAAARDRLGRRWSLQRAARRAPQCRRRGVATAARPAAAQAPRRRQEPHVPARRASTSRTRRRASRSSRHSRTSTPRRHRTSRCSAGRTRRRRLPRSSTCCSSSTRIAPISCPTSRRVSPTWRRTGEWGDFEALLARAREELRDGDRRSVTSLAGRHMLRSEQQGVRDRGLDLEIEASHEALCSRRPGCHR